MTWFLNLMVFLPSGHKDAFLFTRFPHILPKLRVYETSQHNVICQVSFCGKFCKNLWSKNVLLSDIHYQFVLNDERHGDIHLSLIRQMAVAVLVT
jgi:hypothetical protein